GNDACRKLVEIGQGFAARITRKATTSLWRIIFEFHGDDRQLVAPSADADEGGTFHIWMPIKYAFDTFGEEWTVRCLHALRLSPAIPESALVIEIADVTGAMPHVDAVFRWIASRGVLAPAWGRGRPGSLANLHCCIEFGPRHIRR